MLRVGVIGFGAIGRQVADGILAGVAGEVELCAILTRRSRSGLSSVPATTDLGAFLSHMPQVVVEAASAAAVAQSAVKILGTGASLIVASSSALVDGRLRSEIDEACRRAGARVYVPAGALAGLDALSAAALASIDEAMLRVIEPGPVAHFEFSGPALEAAQRYPDRLNIAATAALASGAEIKVNLERQAAAGARSIELSARGAFGELSARMIPRPRADQLSHIVALSLLATLRRLQQPIWIG